MTDWFAIGAGPELRVSDVKLFQSIGALNPYTNRFADVAHVQIVSDGMEMAFSFGAGTSSSRPTPAPRPHLPR